MAKIINKEDFEYFKKKYNEWSGFNIYTEDFEEIKDEIKSKKWTLECEVSEEADRLSNLLKKCFEDEDS